MWTTRFGLHWQSRAVVKLPPMWMQRQMISLDVHMVPQSGALMRANQRYALVHVLEAEGRLLDAEVMGASDASARTMAVEVLRRTSFRIPNHQVRERAFEGTVLLAVP